MDGDNGKYRFSGGIRTGLTVSIVAIVLMSYILIASANSTISFSAHTPGKNATLAVSNSNVSVYVKSTGAILNGNTVYAKLNGNSVTPAFQYKGFFDSCTDAWIVQSYYEGTISFSTSGLANGTYTVEVGIADQLNNVAVETWSFTVATNVKFSDYWPMNNVVIGIPKPVISVLAKDGTIDQDRKIGRAHV